MEKENIEKGHLFCRKMKEVRAIQVTRKNETELKQFVGNGSMVIERKPDGAAWFEFVNGKSVARAIENSYIVDVGGGFEVVNKMKFEDEFEPKYEKE